MGSMREGISRFKKGKAVGSDLLDGYLLRIATEDIQKDYWRLLVKIVETKAYVRENGTTGLRC